MLQIYLAHVESIHNEQIFNHGIKIEKKDELYSCKAKHLDRVTVKQIFLFFSHETKSLEEPWSVTGIFVVQVG